MSINVLKEKVSGSVGELTAGVRVMGRGILLAVSAAPRAAVGFVLLILPLSAAPILQVWLSKRIVDALAGLGHPDKLNGLLILAVLYTLTLLVPMALRPVQEMLQVWVQDHSIAKVDRKLIDAGGRMLDLARLENPVLQDELRVMQSNSWVLTKWFRLLDEGIGIPITLVGLATLLGGLNSLLPVAMLVLILPHLVAEFRAQGSVYDAMASTSRLGREMHYYSRLATESTAAKEIRVFGLGDFLLSRFQDRFDRAFSEVSRTKLRNLRLTALLGGLHALVLGGGFWYVASRAREGGLTIGDVALYINAIVQVEMLFTPLSTVFGLARSSVLYFQGLFRFLGSAGPSIALPPPGAGHLAPAGIKHSVELAGVGFAYERGPHRVLDNVSFTIPAGKVTALVGHNGAGKSTIVKLLTRMYDPTEGTILLDGIPLREYDLESLRSRIAVVYQDFARFSLTLRENVAVGAGPRAASVGTRVEEAARWSGADSVARKLTNGYDTELTRRFEGGVELSGGEWQKVALARGFIRDAALVILDEPTSALDAEAEHRLFERFRRIISGKTALIISHRFSTVRMAEEIVVLENGSVVETGGHDGLMANGGRYAELFEMQAGRYR